MTNESVIKTVEVACDLCSGSDFQLQYVKSDHKLNLAQEFQVVKCNNCNFSFVNPQPVAEDLGKMYPHCYYENRNSADWNKKYEIRYKYIKDLPGKKILDIGCANGDFLNYIRRYGYEVTGYEEVGPVCGYDFNVYSGDSDAVIAGIEKQDIVTAWGVLEHLQKPSRYFELSRSVLKDNGFFVFLVTNAESISSRHLYGEDIPRHMSFFSPSVIYKYADRYGFTVKKIYHRNDVYSMSYLDSMNFLTKRMMGKTLSQYDILSYRITRGESVGKTCLKTSSLVGKLVKAYEAMIRRNGILTAVLQKSR